MWNTYATRKGKPGDDGRQKELREMLTYYKEQGTLPMSVDDAVTMMKPNYDNYCFSKNKLADCRSQYPYGL